MSALFIAQVNTLPLLHALTRNPEWDEAGAGGEIVFRDNDAALPAWRDYPQIRELIFPWVSKLEIVHVGAVVAVKLDPGKEVTMPEGIWYEAVLQASPDVVTEFGDVREVLPPGTLWMWEGPMRRANPTKYPAIFVMMALEAA